MSSLKGTALDLVIKQGDTMVVIDLRREQNSAEGGWTSHPCRKLWSHRILSSSDETASSQGNRGPEFCQWNIHEEATQSLLYQLPGDKNTWSCNYVRIDPWRWIKSVWRGKGVLLLYTCWPHLVSAKWCQGVDGWKAALGVSVRCLLLSSSRHCFR